MHRGPVLLPSKIKTSPSERNGAPALPAGLAPYSSTLTSTRLSLRWFGPVAWAWSIPMKSRVCWRAAPLWRLSPIRIWEKGTSKNLIWIQPIQNDSSLSKPSLRLVPHRDWRGLRRRGAPQRRRPLSPLAAGGCGSPGAAAAAGAALPPDAKDCVAAVSKHRKASKCQLW